MTMFIPHKYVLLIVIGLAGTIAASAQTSKSARELIEEDVTRIGCTLHTYEAGDMTDTPAPRGYKPFYVSHFGRHGSRYQSSESKFSRVMCLKTIRDKGLLTPEGELLCSRMDSIIDIHKGMYGYLTQTGSLEHQGVADRLYRRYPGIFRQKDRKEVLAVSSTVVRCLQSMSNFCTALVSDAPDLKVSYYTNGRLDDSLTRIEKGRPVLPGKDTGSYALDSIKHAVINVDRMMKAFFSDPAEALKHIPDADPVLLFYDVISGGVIEQCLDEKAPAIYSHFSTDELYNFWRCNNAYALNAHGFCYENKMANARRGQYILRDFIAKADQALQEGSHKAADLRFSHDSQVLPFIFFLGLEGCDKLYHLGQEVDAGWYAFQNICMCTNVQMIFYRNRAGDVLVKFLHNEEEKKLAGLEPFCGPYYKWTELRPYLVGLTGTDLEIR